MFMFMLYVYNALKHISNITLSHIEKMDGIMMNMLRKNMLSSAKNTVLLIEHKCQDCVPHEAVSSEW